MPESSVARWYSPRGRLSEDEAGLRPARPLYRRDAFSMRTLLADQAVAAIPWLAKILGFARLRP
jgi:hypothetical protein